MKMIKLLSIITIISIFLIGCTSKPLYNDYCEDAVFLDNMEEQFDEQFITNAAAPNSEINIDTFLNFTKKDLLSTVKTDLAKEFVTKKFELYEYAYNKLLESNVISDEVIYNLSQEEYSQMLENVPDDDLARISNYLEELKNDPEYQKYSKKTEKSRSKLFKAGNYREELMEDPEFIDYSIKIAEERLQVLRSGGYDY